MKQLNVFIASMVLTMMAFAPAVARADEDMDDLEVTMEVLDNVVQLDGQFAEMEGPDDDDVRDEDWESEEEYDESDDERDLLRPSSLGEPSARQKDGRGATGPEPPPPRRKI